MISSFRKPSVKYNKKSHCSQEAQKRPANCVVFCKKIKLLECYVNSLTTISSSLSAQNLSKKRLWSFFTKRLFFLSAHLKTAGKTPEIVDNGDNSGYNPRFRGQITPCTDVDNSAQAPYPMGIAGWSQPPKRFFSLWTFLLDREKRLLSLKYLILFVRFYWHLSDFIAAWAQPVLLTWDWFSKSVYDTLAKARQLKLAQNIFKGG